MLGVSFVTFGGWSFLRLGVSPFYVWGLVFLRLGVSFLTIGSRSEAPSSLFELLHARPLSRPTLVLKAH